MQLRPALNSVHFRRCVGKPNQFLNVAHVLYANVDDNEGQGEGIINKREKEESIEDLVERASNELDEKRQQAAQEALEKELRRKKVKEDREYERYWNRVTGGSSKSLSKAQMTQKEYYSMSRRGEKSSMKRMDNVREMYSRKGLEVAATHANIKLLLVEVMILSFMHYLIIISLKFHVNGVGNGFRSRTSAPRGTG